MTRFAINIDGTYIKYISIGGIHYKITVSKEEWDTIPHRKIKDHINYWKKDPTRKLRYGKYEVIDNIPTTQIFICEGCSKSYKTRAGYINHIHNHHKEAHIEHSTELSNIRTEAPITNITTNNNIQINLPPLRNFNEENQNWLTHEVIMEAIRDIPTAIPYLIKEKHFNDKFPENQNLRIENKRSIRKRLKVYDGGMWRLKDRPEVEYRLIEQVYHVLFDFVEMMTEEDDEEEIDDDASPIERRIASITRRIRTSELRIARVRQSLRGWERFKDSIEGDYDKTIEPFKDKMDTFLLDNELKIEQLKERRALLMN